MLSSSSPRAECLRQLQRAGLGWPRCGGEIFCNSSVGVGGGWWLVVVRSGGGHLKDSQN